MKRAFVALVAVALLGLASPAHAQDAGVDGAAVAPTTDTADAGAPDTSADAAVPDTAAALPASEVVSAIETPAPDLALAPPSGNALERLFDLPGEWKSRGELGLDGRIFLDDDDPITVDKGLGLAGRLELRHRHGAFDEGVRVFGRMDRYDDLRSTLVWEEAFAQWSSERVRLRVGLDIVNWTALEAFHPADVINARNYDSDLENLEKIGEPMVALLVRPFGETSITVLAMPYRSEPLLSSPRSRLSFAPGYDLSDSRFMVDRNGHVTRDNWGPQAALLVRQVLGSADLTVHALEHMDRSQPAIILDPVRGRPLLLYQTVRQLGGTYQQAVGTLLLKVEGAYRHFVDRRDPLPGSVFGALTELPDHGQLAAGLEWGITHGGGPESTFLLEGQALLGVPLGLRSALSIFQRDVLVGYRLALNDESGKELLLGAIFDTDTLGETLLNLSYLQRLGETWTLRAGVRLFFGDFEPFRSLRNADHVRLTLIRHF
jgi:hypothetical protein